ncbi:MAG: hypothetical protein BWX75_00348 [Candidatus Cloacimonetes bacterium ADurb.Bin088]|jgi:hypothetical protein|nr:MAG: hypothetical protein BWX75_00348 [Candidatus Cloacimonetes bacterium ADurb.Bin088]
MQARFLKDFAIALIVILLLAYAIRLYALNLQQAGIPDESKYTQKSVSDTLLNKIKTIESSIQDRKFFQFTTTRDPLRQGNVIKDKFDMEKEFMQMVFNTFRPTGTYLDKETGKRMVNIELMGKIYTAGVGDVVEGRKITWINEENIGIYYGGAQTLAVQKIPPMPDFSKEKTGSNNLDNY